MGKHIEKNDNPLKLLEKLDRAWNMFEVDRIAAVVRPTKAMLEWLYTQPSQYDHVTLESLQEDCVVLLIPPFDGPKQSMEYIRQIYKGILEAELISWGVPESARPKDCTLDTFLKWFKVEFHSVIYDVMYLQQEKVGEPI